MKWWAVGNGGLGSRVHQTVMARRNGAESKHSACGRLTRGGYEMGILWLGIVGEWKKGRERK